MSVIDVADHFKAHYDNVVKAERRGKDVLILFSSDDGYELVYRWLGSEGAPIYSVLGQELSRWDKSEVDLSKPLFEQFRLFP